LNYRTVNLLLGALLCGALLVRWAYFQERRAEPDFTFPDVDALYHDYWARGLAFDQWTPPTGMEDPALRARPYFRPPGYPFFLAAVYRLTGGSYWAPRWIQACLGLFDMLLAYWIAARVVGRWVGALYAFLVGFYWILIYFEGELLDPALNVFLLMCLTAVVLLWVERRRAGWMILAGVLLGLGALVRPNMLIALPVGVAWLGWASGSRAEFARAAVSWCLGCVLMLTPAAVRNWRVARDSVLISSNAGINFFIGNNPEATGYCMDAIPGCGPYRTCFDYPRIVRVVAQQVGRPLRDSEVSAHFQAEGLRFFREHPGRGLRLLLKKAALFWGRAEVAHNKVESMDRRASRVLGWLPGDFPFFLCLGGLGAVAAWRARGNPELRRQTLMLGFMGFFSLAYFFSVWPFFAAARYRVPIIPFVLLFAALGVQWIALQIQTRNWARLAAGAAAAAPIYLLLSWNWTGYREPVGRWYFDRGWAWVRQGRLAEAEEQFRRALDHDPDEARARINLGILRGLAGDFTDAEAQFRRALAVQTNPEVLNNLGYALYRQGRAMEALPYFDRALELDPEFIQARNNRAAAAAASRADNGIALP